jgi:hypothetical protein
MQRNWSSLIRPKRIDVDEGHIRISMESLPFSLWKEDLVSRWAMP